MFELPTSVEVNGKEYHIRNDGDFRMVVDCFMVLNDSELEASYRILTCMVIFYDGMEDLEDVLNEFGDNLEEACKEMYKFFNCGSIDSNNNNRPKLVDWNKDQQLIIGAINNVACKEVRAEKYMHWWTFMGYYSNIGDGAFATIIGIRSKIKRNKPLDNYEKEFKRDNPEYFVWDSKTVEEKEAEEQIREIWNSGK